MKTAPEMIHSQRYLVDWILQSFDNSETNAGLSIAIF